MRIVTRAGALNRLLRVQAAVRKAEKQFVNPKIKHQLRKNDWAWFLTQAPRGAEYGATPAEPFLQTIEALELSPKLSFADLGSGLGNACFAAGLHFEQVTGFELDGRLVDSAKRIKQQFGFTNILFRAEDFLTTNLSSFQVFYLYHPFVTNFAELMALKMQTLRSGTIIIANVHESSRQRIFQPEHFRLIYQLDTTPPSAFDHEKFHTFERI